MFHIASLSGVDIRPYSACQNESEILLLPGTCLIVQGILPVAPGVKMIQMEEIFVPGLVQ